MPEIERSGPKLIYQQVEEWIRTQISSGHWPEHYRLPSELDLAAQLGVSRGTVRKAINKLISDGILVAIHGRGTFVEASVIEQPLAEKLIAFSEALIEKNIPFTTHVITKKLITPPPRIASLLSIDKDEQVFYMERVRSVRGSPIIFLKNYVSIRKCPDIMSVDFEKKRLFETLEEIYGLELGWGQRTFQADTADETVARMLDISPCDPVMYLEQLLYLKDGSPIEVSNDWLKGSSFRISAQVKRDEKRQFNREVLIMDNAES